jgi:hypothetical protein
MPVVAALVGVQQITSTADRMFGKVRNGPLPLLLQGKPCEELQHNITLEGFTHTPGCFLVDNEVVRTRWYPVNGIPGIPEGKKARISLHWLIPDP